ncbi:hypothetical protein [Clostridium cellulovorans]|jgi:hypothetical protein|uniref:Uncharacterized protein n=1 Tax=Clostridium cellulovorans (strain ATCC 35296 / DSM 3052 / OCM 3 / 743B) TaxID=573061 RepID=D9SWG7_CLOC7|nr:hypothetical protein [Clostridium cellulovorans]ADL53249.1 hypothetical protein Clocel_3574 [Clostridium cellulovorans 743B]
MKKEIIEAIKVIKGHCALAGCDKCDIGKHNNGSCKLRSCSPNLYGNIIDELEWKIKNQPPQKKTYKIWELLGFPVGTEFIYQNAVYEITWNNDHKVIKEQANRAILVMSDLWLNAEFILVEKPVTFTEVMQARNAKCRVEHKDFVIDDYYDFSEILTLILEDESEDIKDVMNNGKWFIEGGASS